MIRRLRPLVSLLTLLGVSIFASAESSEQPIRWISEHYPPYNFQDEGGNPRGMSVEVVTHLWDVLKLSPSQRKIEFLPWARGYGIVQRQTASVLFSTTYTPQRLELFAFVGPVFPIRVAIISPRSRALSILNIDQLNQLRIGVVRRDIGEQLLLEQGVDKKAIVSTNSVNQLIKLLKADRVDGIAYAEGVTRWTMDKQGVDFQDYESVYTLLEGKLGLAFNKDTDKKLLGRIQREIELMENQGTLERISDRYLKSLA
ncbi:MAG: transporter substrate-binding domain-containing protein, partial [Motiliproteus sp.]|nr:transporter substrate-binding domain-containing protein [Motiliproteus sp.]